MGREHRFWRGFCAQATKKTRGPTPHTHRCPSRPRLGAWLDELSDIQADARPPQGRESETIVQQDGPLEPPALAQTGKEPGGASASVWSQRGLAIVGVIHRTSKGAV